jgi:hypothetical protein
VAIGQRIGRANMTDSPWNLGDKVMVTFEIVTSDPVTVDTKGSMRLVRIVDEGSCFVAKGAYEFVEHPSLMQDIDWGED